VKVRRATEADQPAMRNLWEAFTREATYTPYPGAPFSPSILTEHLGLLAEDGREPVGCVYANTGNDGFGFVFGLYVRPEMRRRGCARLLMRSVAEQLQNAGKGYIVLSVDTPNTAGRSFYEGLGFTDAARTLRVEVNSLL
jgi:ribosomal protein S18 acetylase RimI-like enzyme